MPTNNAYLCLYQMNTQVRLTEISRQLGRPASLDDIPDQELDQLAEMGFDWIWMLSVWQTGPAGRQISRNNMEWRKEFEETLPDLSEDDISGSGFAIAGYQADCRLGGDEALARLRERLQKRNLKLMLDFVPNHTSLDHPWVEDCPDYYIHASEMDLTRAPMNYTWAKRVRGDILLAHGRDPYFPGWPDTLQLNYGNPALQDAMVGELVRISGQCDGVRCDMAMLILPEVFMKTWKVISQPFWPKAINTVRNRYPGFLFMAEVYWNLEWTLQQQGFDYTYDKNLYDRLRKAHARPIREHFLAGLDYQNKLARFLENHDEPRAAATFLAEIHEAAAALTFLAPGLRFFHQGQLEGKKKRISPHLMRGPEEPVDMRIEQFYQRLLEALRLPVVRNGEWRLIECLPAWDDNWTVDCFLAFSWSSNAADHLLVVVNYATNQSQCYVPIPFEWHKNSTVRFKDLMGGSVYDRDGNDLSSKGLYLDMPPWGYHVFEVTPTPTTTEKPSDVHA